MHVALPQTPNKTLAKPVAAKPVIAQKDNSAEKFNLKDRIKAANLDLAETAIRSKEHAELPSNAQKILDIRKKHGIDVANLIANGLKEDDVEMHFHKQKDPKTGEVMLHPITKKPLKIVELVDKSHSCDEHATKALHEPEKKTSNCTGPSCKPEPEKRKGFWANLFSIAA